MSAEILKIFPGPGYLHCKDGVNGLWYSLVNLYIWLTILYSYSSIPLVLGLIGRDGGLSSICYSRGFARRHRMLKTFRDPGYLLLEDGVIWLWHSLVSLYIWLNILSCYGSVNLNLGLIGREVGLITLCQSWGFFYHQKFLKTFPGLGYLCSEDRSYSSIPLVSLLTGSDGGLITLCHSCGFLSEKRVLKMFSSPSYLYFENGYEFQ